MPTTEPDDFRAGFRRFGHENRQQKFSIYDHHMRRHASPLVPQTMQTQMPGTFAAPATFLLDISASYVQQNFYRIGGRLKRRPGPSKLRNEVFPFDLVDENTDYSWVNAGSRNPWLRRAYASEPHMNRLQTRDDALPQVFRSAGVENLRERFVHDSIRGEQRISTIRPRYGNRATTGDLPPRTYQVRSALDLELLEPRTTLRSSQRSSFFDEPLMAQSRFPAHPARPGLFERSLSADAISTLNVPEPERPAYRRAFSHSTGSMGELLAESNAYQGCDASSSAVPGRGPEYGVQKNEGTANGQTEAMSSGFGRQLLRRLSGSIRRKDKLHHSKRTN